jgi:hypothetical protein
MRKILCLVTLTLCLSVCASAQTIADIARRERARQQPQSNVTITNADLKKKTPVTAAEEKKPGETQAATPATGTTPNTTTTTAVTPSPTPAATPAAGSSDTRDEKWWRDKFDAARTDIRRAENQVALAQLEVNSANRDYQTRSYDPGNVGLTAIATAQKKLDDANKAVAAGRAKLAQLENDLRQAGAPAGWAR